MIDLSPGNIFIWKDSNNTMFIIYLILKPSGIKSNNFYFIIISSNHKEFPRGFKGIGEFIDTFVDFLSVSIELIN